MSSWDLATSNSSLNLLNNNSSSYKNLFDSAVVNLTSNSSLKTDIPIKIEEVKPEKKELKI